MAWSSLIDLFRESVLVQGLLALVVVSTVMVLLVMGVQVPPELWAVVGVIVGYYFGSDRAVTLRKYLALKKSSG